MLNFVSIQKIIYRAMLMLIKGRNRRHLFPFSVGIMIWLNPYIERHRREAFLINRTFDLGVVNTVSSLDSIENKREKQFLVQSIE